MLEGARSGDRASLRKDNRATLPRLERDGMTGLIKFNPLVDWTDAELDTYVNSNSVPTNSSPQGLPSIGAPQHTGRARGEHPRAGRWWWDSPQGVRLAQGLTKPMDVQNHRRNVGFFRPRSFILTQSTFVSYLLRKD